VWKQYILVAALLVLSLVLIGAVAFAALAPQLVTPPAAVPGGRVVLALDQMPAVGGEPRFYGAPLVDEAHEFWLAQPAPGELVAFPARWSPAEGGPECEVLALEPLVAPVWGFGANCPEGAEVLGSPIFGLRGEPIAAPRSLARYLVSVDGERVIVNVAREIREYGATPQPRVSPLGTP
jgi:hypothetical protein